MISIVMTNNDDSDNNDDNDNDNDNNNNDDNNDNNDNSIIVRAVPVGMLAAAAKRRAGSGKE